jgi:hypothetical protein
MPCRSEPMREMLNMEVRSNHLVSGTGRNLALQNIYRGCVVVLATRAQATLDGGLLHFVLCATKCSYEVSGMRAK